MQALMQQGIRIRNICYWKHILIYMQCDEKSDAEARLLSYKTMCKRSIKNTSVHIEWGKLKEVEDRETFLRGVRYKQLGW